MIPRLISADIEKQLTTPDVVVITGMRRVGKTTLLSDLYEKTKKKYKVFLDLELATNQILFENSNYDAIIQSVFPGIQTEDYSKCAFFLDEIQLVKTLPSVVKYLRDHYQVKFFLSGSSSFYLKNLFSESLAGRKVLFELFPLHFSEFLQFKGANIFIPEGKITERDYLTIQPLYEEYVRYGGFPEVVLATSEEAKKTKLLDIFSSYYQKEVVALADFRTNTKVRQLMLLLIERAGSLLDLTKLSAQLGITRQTVSDYLDFLEGTYFLSRIQAYSGSSDVSLRKSAKVYIADTGFLQIFSTLEKGHVFENAIYHQLRVRHATNSLFFLTYYQQKDGQEIDFILEKNHGIEVKRFATKTDEKKLARLAEKIGLEQTTLVSYDYAPLPSVRYGFQM